MQRHCKVTLRLEEIYANGGRSSAVVSSSVLAHSVNAARRPAKRVKEHALEAPTVLNPVLEQHFTEWPKEELIAKLYDRLDILAGGLLAKDESSASEQQHQQHDASGIADTESSICARAKACGLKTISVTKSLQRLYAIAVQCLAHDEPVLLVGDTGCGKTTVVQVGLLMLWCLPASSDRFYYYLLLMLLHQTL